NRFAVRITECPFQRFGSTACSLTCSCAIRNGPDHVFATCLRALVTRAAAVRVRRPSPSHRHARPSHTPFSSLSRACGGMRVALCRGRSVLQHMHTTVMTTVATYKESQCTYDSYSYAP